MGCNVFTFLGAGTNRKNRGERRPDKGEGKETACHFMECEKGKRAGFSRVQGSM